MTEKDMGFGEHVEIERSEDGHMVTSGA